MAEPEGGRISKTLSTTVKASVAWSHQNALSGSLTAQNVGGWTYSQALTNGTGSAGTADLIYAVQTTLAGGASTNIDLAGSLADFFGSTITMARAKVLFVWVTTDTGATSVTVGGHATASLKNWITATPDLDTAQPGVVVRNGGCFLLCAQDATAYAVTATTDDLLKLLNNDGSTTATLKLAFVGGSA